MQKVNNKQNDQLILRHTTTDHATYHASLLPLLLRKVNTQPDYYHPQGYYTATHVDCIKVCMLSQALL